MEKDFLTIREVSDLVNKSYQNIYQRCDTSLKKYVSVIDGRRYLHKDVLREFNTDNKVGQVEEVSQPFEEKVQPILNEDDWPLHDKDDSELLKLVELLREEVKRKDEIIISKDEQLKKQTEEILSLSNRVVELFENSQKLQLQTSFLLSENNSKNDDDFHTLRPSEENVDKSPKKRGIFARFFK